MTKTSLLIIMSNSAAKIEPTTFSSPAHVLQQPHSAHPESPQPHPQGLKQHENM